MTWETIDVNVKAKVLFVQRVPGISVVDWDVDFKGELHTVLVRKIRSVLKGEDTYPYLSESCLQRLGEIRYLAQGSGILDRLVTPLSERRFAIFPWIGTRQLFTLHYALMERGVKSKVPWDTCVYIEVYYSGTATELEREIGEILHSDLDLNTLPFPEKVEIANKYNDYVPPLLLRKQFVEDFLDFEGLKKLLG
jgi:ATP-dependent Lhr-like helicase